ncbi:Bifunctional purine biosynthesis protein PurH [Streptobacillus moniliformis]|nr:Bifunctional purine biosynthesis protein PurH [Streptobacillus moniliformis]
MVKVDGGMLYQDVDNILYSNLKVVTEKTVNDSEMKDLIFGLKVVKYVKSNGIVVAKDGKTLGIGAGEVSRIWAAEKALERSKKTSGAIMASDAFFPFEDVVELSAKYGISSIIQPGGSINDEKSIKACNMNNIAMVISEIRHFKH